LRFRGHAPEGFVGDEIGIPPNSLAPALPLVEPIVPVLYPAPFDGPEWLFEPKYDGFRGLLYLGGRVPLPSEAQKRAPALPAALLLVRDELVERDVILDGEVVALDEQGRQDFRLLMRGGGGNLHYAVFDILWLKGKDLRECPLSRRKRIPSRLVKKTPVAGLSVSGGAGVICSPRSSDSILKGSWRSAWPIHTLPTLCGGRCGAVPIPRWRAAVSCSIGRSDEALCS
jgi:bifunctional non-homologous end joining protein LigD